MIELHSDILLMSFQVEAGGDFGIAIGMANYRD